MIKYSGTTGSGMKSQGLYLVDEIFNCMDGENLADLPAHIQRKCLKSGRIKLFKAKGVICCACNLEANYFSLDSQVNNPSNKPHLNLYSLMEDKFILFTKDHIIPRSLGGPDHIDNYDTMCAKCNEKRGNELPSRVKALTVISNLRSSGYKFLKPIKLSNLEPHELPEVTQQ